MIKNANELIGITEVPQIITQPSIEELTNLMKIELQDGIHSYPLCSCRRMPSRGNKCRLCLQEELFQLTKGVNQ